MGHDIMIPVARFRIPDMRFEIWDVGCVKSETGGRFLVSGIARLISRIECREASNENPIPNSKFQVSVSVIL